jgi:hypothetical protein
MMRNVHDAANQHYNGSQQNTNPQEGPNNPFYVAIGPMSGFLHQMPPVIPL